MTENEVVYVVTAYFDTKAREVSDGTEIKITVWGVPLLVHVSHNGDYGVYGGNPVTGIGYDARIFAIDAIEEELFQYMLTGDI